MDCIPKSEHVSARRIIKSILKNAHNNLIIIVLHSKLNSLCKVILIYRLLL